MTGERPQLPDWCRSLELEVDPFALGALPNFYFAGAGRRYFLQQAVQQLHFGAGRVVVVGAEGSGKSTLVDACLAELEDVADRMLVRASTETDAGVLRRGLAAAAGLPDACAEDEQSLLDALAELVPGDGEPQPVVLAVDDAHHLDDAALAAVARLHDRAHGRVRLLLAGEPGLLDILDAVAEPPDFERLRLTPLTVDEVGDYLLARLRAAGLQGELPLDDLALEELAARSGGHIGALHALAPRLLAMPRTDTPAAVARGLPVWHLIAASALLGLIVLGLVYLREDSSAPQQELALFLPEPEGPAPAGREREAAPLPVAESGADPGGVAPGGPAPPAPPPAEASPAAPPGTPPEPVPADPPREVAEPAAADAALSADERSILMWPREAFVIQLFAAHDRDRVRAVTAALEPPARIYQAELQGRPWFVAVAGPFEQREAASAAIPGLPQTLRAAGPWIRPAADVQGQIRGR